MEKVDRLPVKRGRGAYSLASFQDPVKFEKGVPYYMYKRREELEDDTPPPPADKEDPSQKKRRPPKAMYTWVFHDGIGSEAKGIHMEGGEVSRGPESTFIIMQYDKHEKVCYATPVGDWVNLSRMKVGRSGTQAVLSSSLWELIA